MMVKKWSKTTSIGSLKQNRSFLSGLSQAKTVGLTGWMDERKLYLHDKGEVTP